MTSLFVTSSGTGIGKTFIMRALIGQLRRAGRRVEALKPVISGFDPAAPEATDAGAILSALGRATSAKNLDRLSPWRFAAPLSPNMAAAREGRGIDFDRLVAHCQEHTGGESEVLLVEGVGGVMVPLDERHTVLDWIAALRMRALLVVGSYLGTLSHTLTAAAALQARQVECHVVVSESADSPVPLEETVASLVLHLPGCGVTGFPRGSPSDPASATLAQRLALQCPLAEARSQPDREGGHGGR